MSGRPREFDPNVALEAAMDAFWLNGYEATSAQDLVNHTGLGRGSLYAAFGNKENLYRKALIHYQDLSLHAQKEILMSQGNAKDRLRNLMLWGIDNDLIRHNDRNGCMALLAWLERAVKDPEVEQISQQYISNLERVLCRVFTEGKKNGDITASSSPLNSARAFMSSYFGLRLLGRSMRNREFLTSIVDSTIERL